MRISTVIDTISYHCYSLWGFTFSDLKTIVGPSLVFGVSNALAGAKYGLESPAYANGKDIVRRLPLVLFWVWINLLPFTINNQRSVKAIKEDKLNKPWRPLPSQRMTTRQAHRLMVALYFFALTISLVISGIRQAASLVILGTWYNNFAGGDASCLVRNFINAFGYICFTAGAMEVALGSALPLRTQLVQWFGMIAGIIFTTVHLQDMYDQAGDRIRGRKTVPLVIGDFPARCSIAVSMVFWIHICPIFWNVNTIIMVLSVSLGATVAARTLLVTSIQADRLTFKIWNIWMTLVFMLPLMSF